MSQLHLRTSQLESALSQGLLPQDLVHLGTRLLQGLQRPTQITVFGMPGSGKTSILNMILGANSMPDLKGISAVELCWGETAHGTIESRTGEEASFEGVADAGMIPEDTLRVVQHLPLDQLKGKRLVEINFTKLLGAGSEIIDWATQDTDIAIWCSKEFTEAECAIWTNVPDRLKDNGFLALTHADRLQMQGKLQDHVTDFEKRFADEFAGLYPVATLQAVAACVNGRVEEHALWKASGCKALSDVIEKAVEQGKQADAEHAEVLLARAKVNTVPTPDVTIHEPGDVLQEPMGQHEALETALSILQQSSESLPPEHVADMSASDILDHCAQTSQALAALFMDTEIQDPIICAFREDALEAEQKIQLLHLERDEKAATDAIVVLLQMKKEMAQADPRQSHNQ